MFVKQMREESEVVVEEEAGGLAGIEDGQNRVEEDAEENAEGAKSEEDKELEEDVLTKSMVGLVSDISRAFTWHWMPSEAEHAFKYISSI